MHANYRGPFVAASSRGYIEIAQDHSNLIKSDAQILQHFCEAQVAFRMKWIFDCRTLDISCAHDENENETIHYKLKLQLVEINFEIDFG